MGDCKSRLIISDIDGVLADSSRRLSLHIPKLDLVSGDHNEWVKLWIPYNNSPDILRDEPIDEGIELFHALRSGLRADEFRFVTVRGEQGRHFSYQWLREHVVKDDFPEEWILMSPSPVELRPGVYWEKGMPIYDAVNQKRSQISSLAKDYDIVVAIDDRPDICQAYWEIGVHAMLVKFPEHDCQGLMKEDVCLR